MSSEITPRMDRAHRTHIHTPKLLPDVLLFFFNIKSQDLKYCFNQLQKNKQTNKLTHTILANTNQLRKEGHFAFRLTANPGGCLLLNISKCYRHLLSVSTLPLTLTFSPDDMPQLRAKSRAHPRISSGTKGRPPTPERNQEAVALLKKRKESDKNENKKEGTHLGLLLDGIDELG